MQSMLDPSTIRLKEIGRVKSVRKIIARVTGLSSFMNGQLVTFSDGNRGLIAGFSAGEVLVLILGDESRVRIGQEVSCVQQEFKIPVGQAFMGRIVNALAEPVDGKDLVSSGVEYSPVFREAPETMDRAGVTDSLETGIKMIDAIVPVARGQRQMIIGDRMTGKTTVAVDAILNQKGRDVVCIYCCIGKSSSSLTKVVQLLKSGGALDHTLVVAAPACATVAQQYLAPYSAAALGEYFLFRGKDVLVVFDDMTKHAWAYRQISLLLERPPGREAYPGDIYYIHSQLMERAGKLHELSGSGSMTFFPIVETLQQNVTGFIPSNLISMTDGQIYLSSSLFAEGFKPAVDLALSVSIIGRKVQHPVLKGLAGAIRLEFAHYKELQRLTKLKSSLSPVVLYKLRRGEIITVILTQEKNFPVSVAEMIVLLYTLDRKMLDGLSAAMINTFKNNLAGELSAAAPQLAAALESATELTPLLTGELDAFLARYIQKIETE
ncbi:MAG: F0F1 ATP synthase subunit alpha [Candidatus Omnitrophota bacterium]